jgi:hypothetical protein
MAAYGEFVFEHVHIHTAADRYGWKVPVHNKEKEESSIPKFGIEAETQTAIRRV